MEVNNIVSLECENSHYVEMHLFAKLLINDFCINKVQLALSEVNYNSYLLMQEFSKQWPQFEMFAHALGKVFRYLERVYLSERKMRSIVDEAVSIFKDLVYYPIQDKLIDTISRGFSLTELDLQENDQQCISIVFQAVEVFNMQNLSPDKKTNGKIKWTGDKVERIDDNSRILAQLFDQFVEKLDSQISSFVKQLPVLSLKTISKIDKNGVMKKVTAKSRISKHRSSSDQHESKPPKLDKCHIKKHNYPKK